MLPAYDDELTRPVAASLRRLGVARASRLHGAAAGTPPATRCACAARDGDEFELPADRVLVAVGRRPRRRGWGLESLRLDMAGRAVRVDDQCRTSMRNVWAIGDLTGEPMLAHRAMAQGEMVAEIIGGARRHFVPAAIPAVCFTDPEIVVVGRPPPTATRPGWTASARSSRSRPTGAR